MFITYKIVAGDTFAIISKKIFGTEIHGDHIARANPGITTQLTPGTTIVIPPLPDYPENLPTELEKSNENKNEVQLLIDNERFDFWTELTIKRSIDSIDTISFTGPFNYESTKFKELFIPFKYKSLQVFINGERLINGISISTIPSATIKNTIINVSGYSLPGVLEDCTVPDSAFPLEFNNLTILDIAKNLTKPFGLSVVAQSDIGNKFATIAIKPTDKIHSFLMDLAQQRNLVISSTVKGELLLWQSKLSTISTELEHGKPPVEQIRPIFNEQAYYSNITGISFVITGVDGTKYSIKNPFLSDRVRPLTFTPQDTINIDLKDSVNAKAGRMFANMLTYMVDVSTWRDKNGNLWQPNTTIELLAPAAMVYNKYKFILRSVEFKRDRNSETATLELVPPGSFDGKLPESLPWDL